MSSYLLRGGASLVAFTGAGIRIAVVDSGVAPNHPHVGSVHSGISLVGDDPDDWDDRIGHGTAVAAAIREKAPASELIAVRVLEQPLATSARMLARAIHWAVDAGVHIINLSLGTTNQTHVPLFEEALRHANERGVLVLSAASHLETPWFPGALPDAVGVVADVQAPRDGLRVQRLQESARVEAAPFPRPIEGVPPNRNLSGVSFAVANATGLLALCLHAGAPHPPVAALLQWIDERAELDVRHTLGQS